MLIQGILAITLRDGLFDYELVLVGTRHNIRCCVHSCLLSSAFVQTKDLWHVIVWEMVADVILHLLDSVEYDWHQVVARYRSSVAGELTELIIMNFLLFKVLRG